MQFLMLVCTDTEPVDPPETPPMDIDDWVTAMDGRGARLAGEALQPGARAAVVRVRAEGVLVTDGPYLETKEVLCGYDLLECADLAEAVEIAAAHPMASAGVVELRQLMSD